MKNPNESSEKLDITFKKVVALALAMTEKRFLSRIFICKAEKERYKDLKKQETTPKPIGKKTILTTPSKQPIGSSKSINNNPK